MPCTTSRAHGCHFLLTGLKLNSWRNVFDSVLNTINYNKRTDKSQLATLTRYFTRLSPVVPQHLNVYKYDLQQHVLIDLSPEQRKKLGFKYSLNPGTVYLFIATKSTF